jgi:hypothetical protein
MVQVEVVLVTDRNGWPDEEGKTGITSLSKLRAAQKAKQASGDIPTNFFLFFASDLEKYLGMFLQLVLSHRWRRGIYRRPLLSCAPRLMQPARLRSLVGVFPMPQFLKSLFRFFRGDVAVPIVFHVLLHEQVAGAGFTGKQ